MNTVLQVISYQGPRKAHSRQQGLYRHQSYPENYFNNNYNDIKDNTNNLVLGKDRESSCYVWHGYAFNG